MNKIESINISYWYKELDNNPINKVMELQNNLKSIIDADFMINDTPALQKISMPRIQGISNDKKYFFSMSLVNANLVININGEKDSDEVLLLINNYLQLVYDVLKEIYDLEILYSSIKIELTCEDNKEEVLKKLNILDENIEDFSVKKGLKKDNYYINYTISSSKEYNFNINKENIYQEDLYDRTMLISLKDAILNREYIVTNIEINDRLSYNIDPKYLSNKDSLRGMIFELREIIKENNI